MPDDRLNEQETLVDVLNEWELEVVCPICGSNAVFEGEYEGNEYMGCQRCGGRWDDD